MNHVVFKQFGPIGIRNIEKVLADPLEPVRIMVWSNVQVVCLGISDAGCGIEVEMMDVANSR